MPLALSATAIEKSFPVGLLRRPRRVLTGIDLELARGESLGLIGPNGSGKSTLLRVLSGVEAPTAGTVALFGESIDSVNARSRLGFLPESSPFPPELSPRAALNLFGSLRGTERSERRARVDAELRTVGLASDADRPLGRFSKGMLRRFGLAHAFLHEPDVVLLDEPTAGLDATGHVVLEELFSAARARGVALVIASHHVSDIALHCDSVVVLVDGHIVARGTPRELVAETESIRLEVEGLDAAALTSLAAEIERLGGRLVSSGPSAGTFLELYRRIERAAGDESRRKD